MIKTFEEYLEEEFAKDYRGLDDDMPDSLDTWMSNLDVQEVIDYAEEWGSELLNNVQGTNK